MRVYIYMHIYICIYIGTGAGNILKKMDKGTIRSTPTHPEGTTETLDTFFFYFVDSRNIKCIS